MYVCVENSWYLCHVFFPPTSIVLVYPRYAIQLQRPWLVAGGLTKSVNNKTTSTTPVTSRNHPISIMPPNENNRRMTRSQCKAKSSTASATTKKPPSSAATAKAKSSVAKSSVAAANANISGTTKGRGGGRKPSTANSTAAVEYTSEIVTRVDLGLDLPKKERPLKLEQTKSKLVRIIRDLGLSDINTDLTPNDVKVLGKCIKLQDEDFRKLISGLVPGHKERSETRSTLFDHLRKAVFPAPVSIYAFL